MSEKIKKNDKDNNDVKRTTEKDVKSVEEKTAAVKTGGAAKPKKNKNEKNKKKVSLFNNRTFVFVFSIVVAIVCWAAVAFSSSTEIETIIRDVPVTISNGSAYTSYGLEVMDSEAKFVDVTVRGPRTVVGRLNASSIIVSPIFTGVTDAGTYELSLTTSKVNTLENFEIVSVLPRTITLTFDVPSVQRFAVDTSEVIATAADGYIIDKITTDPAEISITGSEEDVARISRVAVKHRFANELSSNARVSGLELYVYDEYGIEMSKDKLRMSATAVDVTVPVYKLGTLQIDIGFTNVPDGFDLDSLGYVLSVTEVEVAGMESTLENLKQPWIIGYIDLTTFEIGKEYDFNIELPTGMVNRGHNTVTVTFPRDDISTKRISVTDIRAENVPANYDVSILTAAIRDVTVIGKTEDVESLLPGSVVAKIDFSQISITSGQYNVAVTFVITSNNTTWVVGSYTVLIDVKTK